MPREIQRERKGRQRERGTERRHRRLRKKQGPPPLFPPPPLFLPRFPHSMERIRGFFFALLGIFAVLSLAAARPAASEEAAGRLSKNDDAVGFGSAPIVNRSLRRLRASAAPAPRRALLDVMPWDTVVDQPGSVATTVREREEKSDKANAELRSETSARGGRERRGLETKKKKTQLLTNPPQKKKKKKQDVIKDPRDPACYDCGRLGAGGGGGKKGGSSSGSGGKLVEPESAAEDEAAEEQGGGEEAAVVVVVEDDDQGQQQQQLLFVAPSVAAAAASPSPAPAPAPAGSISPPPPRHREPLVEGGEMEAAPPLPSSSP